MSSRHWIEMDPKLLLLLLAVVCADPQPLFNCFREFSRRQWYRGSALLLSLRAHGQPLWRTARSAAPSGPRAVPAARPCAVNKTIRPGRDMYTFDRSYYDFGPTERVEFLLRPVNRSVDLGGLEDSVPRLLHEGAQLPTFVSLAGRLQFSHLDHYVLVVWYAEGDTRTLRWDVMMHGRPYFLSGTDSDNAQVVVLVAGDPVTRPVVRLVFETLTSLGTFDAVVMVGDAVPGRVNLYTWLPFEPPSGRCGRFVDVVLLDTWLDGEDRFALNSSSFGRKKHPDRLPGCDFNVSVKENPPFVITEGGTLEGFEIAILRLVAEQMDMRFRPHPSESGHDMFYLGYLNFGTSGNPSNLFPFFALEYTWFVPVAEAYPRWASVRRVFSAGTWLLLLLLLVAAAAALRCFAGCRSVAGGFLSAWAVLLGVVVAAPPRTLPGRVFFLSLLLTSIAVGRVFQTFVTSFLIDPGRRSQVASYEQVVGANLSLSFDSLDMLYRHLLLGKRTGLLFPDTRDMVIFAIQRPGTAFMAADRLFTYSYERICDFDRSVLFHKVRGAEEQVYLTLAPASHIPYKERLNQILHRLVQSGLPEKILRDITDPKGLNLGTGTDVGSRPQYVSLSLSHLLSAFLLFLLGLGISAAAFIAEMVLCWLKCP